MNWLAIFLGGGCGASARYALVRLIGLLGFESAWAIMLINLAGSLLLGIVVGGLLLGEREMLGSTIRLWLQAGFVTGFLGGFTTYATFTLDIVQLGQRHWGLMALYALLSITGGITMLLLGMKIGKGW